MELMNPCGVFETKAAPLAPRVTLGPNVTVGLFANDKKNADVLLEHIRRGLADTFGVREFRWFHEGSHAASRVHRCICPRLRRGRGSRLRLRLLHVVVYP